jgi:dihydropteroate synthase
MIYTQTTLNCNGQLVDLMEPIIMGILNITPDSFYKGSRFTTEKTILNEAEKMLTEGATILDVGGMSSRPGADIISEEEESDRVIPAIRALVKAFPKAIISIDTFRSNIAKAAVTEGVSMINDISAGNMDTRMFETVAELQNIPYILMHMKGTPDTMQKHAVYEDITLEILDFFIEKVGQLRGLLVKDIIIDPGFGFGKTIDHNFELLKKMHVFKILEVPILAGLSRKSMIWKTLKITPDEALNGTSVCNFVALQQGAQILRVHDVKEAKQTIQLWQYLKSN